MYKVDFGINIDGEVPWLCHCSNDLVGRYLIEESLAHLNTIGSAFPHLPIDREKYGY